MATRPWSARVSLLLVAAVACAVSAWPTPVAATPPYPPSWANGAVSFTGYVEWPRDELGQRVCDGRATVGAILVQQPHLRASTIRILADDVLVAAFDSWDPSVPVLLEEGATTFTFEVHSTLSLELVDVLDVTFPDDCTGPQPSPETLIASGPDPQTPATTASFVLDDPTGTAIAFECALNDGAWQACWRRDRSTGVVAAKEAPLVLIEDLHPGQTYVLAVRAVSQGGRVDPTPATWTWAVLDSADPETVLARAPPVRTRGDELHFAFWDPTDRSLTFECQLDAGAWTRCEDVPGNTATPGELVWPSPVEHGETHALAVRGVDHRGVADPSPAQATFTIDREGPQPEIVSGPPPRRPALSRRGRLPHAAGGALRPAGRPRHQEAPDLGAAYRGCRLDRH